MNTMCYAIKPVIKKKLRLTEERYNEMLFNTAMDYLERYLSGNRPLINDFATHPGFWSWWKVQYYIVDRVFEHRYVDSSYKDEFLIEIYRDMHVNMDKQIDNVVWQMISDKQEEMIQELIDKKVNH